MTDTSQRIAELLRQGRKMEAIKFFSEATGVDLSTAKKEIELIAAAMVAEEKNKGGMPSGDIYYSPGGGLPSDVMALVREGKKIEAIKLLRDQTGLGLKEAKDKIDAVDGSRGKGGCAGSILLLVGSAMLAALMM